MFILSRFGGGRGGGWISGSWCAFGGCWERGAGLIGEGGKWRNGFGSCNSSTGAGGTEGNGVLGELVWSGTSLVRGSA